MIIFDLDMTLVDTHVAEEARAERDWQKVYRLIPQMLVYPEMRLLAIHFHITNHKIAIVTNSPEQYSRRVLKYFDIHYDNLIAYHHVKKRKPDVEPYVKAIEQTSCIEVKQILVFGDDPKDIIPAKQLGLQAYACAWGSKTSNDFQSTNPDRIFNSPGEAYHFFIS